MQRPTSINPNPTRFQSWLKRAIVAAYCWRAVSIASAQALVNRFKLWSA